MAKSLAEEADLYPLLNPWQRRLICIPGYKSLAEEADFYPWL
jgi:hypothetical protein